MDTFVAVLTAAESVVTYSILRLPDQASTAALAKRMDLQTHEINPILTFLARRYGLKRSFQITWIVFALGIALADVALNTVASFGIPVIALFFGTTHWLAAAHNVELDYNTEGLTPDEVRDHDREFVVKLRSLDWRGRLALLFKKDIFTVMAAVLCVIVLVMVETAPLMGALTGHPSTTATIYAGAVVLALGFLAYFPSVILGTLVWARRVSKVPSPAGDANVIRGEDGSPCTPSSGRYVEISVGVVEAALSEAKANGADTIRLESTGDG